MNPSFGGSCGLVEFRKVLEAGEWGGVEDDLVKVGRFVELLDRRECLIVLRVERKGVGEMDFGNTKTGVSEGFEGLMAVIKFEGEVTSVVVDADVFANRLLIVVLTFAP